jgi:hypothetical protein
LMKSVNLSTSAPTVSTCNGFDRKNKLDHHLGNTSYVEKQRK